MSTRVDSPVRLGVLGLGRPWSVDLLQSIERRPERFRLVAIQDAWQRRAEAAAIRLGATPAEGIRQVVHHPEVDALAVLGASWQSRIALRIATEAGKPCLIALPWRTALDSLASSTAPRPPASSRIMLALPRRFSASSFRLRELFATRLGTPRLLQGIFPLGNSHDHDRDQPTHAPDSPPPRGVDDLACELIDWCRFLFRSDPVEIQAARVVWRPAGGPGPIHTDSLSLVLRFAGEALAQLALVDGSRHPDGALTTEPRRLGPSFEIITESGRIVSSEPETLHWSNGQEHAEEHLGQESACVDTLVEHFFRLIQGAQSLAPTLSDAVALRHALDQIPSVT